MAYPSHGLSFTFVLLSLLILSNLRLIKCETDDDKDKGKNSTPSASPESNQGTPKPSGDDSKDAASPPDPDAHEGEPEGDEAEEGGGEGDADEAGLSVDINKKGEGPNYKKAKERFESERGSMRRSFQRSYEGHSYSVLRFSYDDNSTLGPKNWRSTSVVKNAIGPSGMVYTTNRCEDGWLTPLSIDTGNVIAPNIKNIEEGDKKSLISLRSLSLIILDLDISNQDWEIGHPCDAYTGLEIKTPQLRQFVLTDRSDPVVRDKPLAWKEIDEYTNYDFSFASIFYCDPKSEAGSGKRSMHQLDGKKFPIEIDFVFFSRPRLIGTDRFICDDKRNSACKTVGVMLAILGDFSEEDNPALEPMLEALKDYEGPDFNANDEDEAYTSTIPGPWSPTWLIPETSSYYYYEDGSFPVPPCWPVGRVYVVKKPIPISHRQLSVLTSIRTLREPTTGNVMNCTYSVLQKHTGDDSHQIKYNEFGYKITGSDDKRGLAKSNLLDGLVVDDNNKGKGRSSRTGESGEEMGVGVGVAGSGDNVIRVLLNVLINFGIMVVINNL